LKENNIKNFIDNSKFNKFHVTLIALGVFLIAFTGYGAAAYGSIIPSILGEWNLDSSKLGFIGSVQEFGSMFGAILLSIISHKLGLKKTLISSVLVFCTFTLAQSTASNVTSFMVYKFMSGIGFGGVIPISISLLAEFAPKSSKSKAVAMALTGNQIGAIIASLVAIVVVPNFGWRPLLWMAFVPIIFMVFIVKMLPESAQFLIRKKDTEQLKALLKRIDSDYEQKVDVVSAVEKSNEVTETEKKVSFMTLFSKEYFLVSLLSCVIVVMGLLFINGVIVWLPSLMVSAGFALGSSLAFTTFLCSGTIAGTIVCSAIADKKGFKLLLPVMYILGSVALMAMGVKTNVAILYLIVTLIGFFLFSAHSLVNAFISQHYPEEIRTTAVGFPNSIGRFGGVFGPTLGGLLLSNHASVTTWFLTFASTGLICAVCFIIINSNFAHRF